MKFSSIPAVGALMGLAVAAVCGRALAGSAVTISVDTSKPGVTIPEDYLGVSMEIQYLLPSKEGKHLFAADNTALVNMFKTLGIKNLRVGGNTTDNPKVDAPAPADIDDLFAFAKEAGVEVIYTLRLRNSTDPTADATAAKYVMDHYKSQLQCFEIGNEPNVYFKAYPPYKEMFTHFMTAITNPDVAPDAMFCGPNTTPGKAEWARLMAVDFGKSGHLKFISQHEYPGGNQRKVKDTDVADARSKMISTGWVKNYEKIYNEFVPAVMEQGLGYRLEETNSFFNGGRENVSNSHASALWGLDYLYWWAAHQAMGLNFHTGDKVAAADDTAPCWYALFWTAADGNSVHPLGYAAKAFDLTGHGAFLPVKIESADNLNLTAYSVQAPDKHVYVTIVNKENGAAAHDATVTIAAGKYGTVETMAMEVPKGDLAATSGETLGGAEIKDDATWDGKWSPVTGADADGKVTVEVPAASAMLVRLTP